MLSYLRFLYVLLLFTLSIGFSQESPIVLNGQAKSFQNDVSNILVVNLNSKESTITDSLGLFSIKAKLRDSLQFRAIQFSKRTIVITDTTLRKKSIIVYLSENIINLNEVTVMPYNLTGNINSDIERLSYKPIITSSTLGLPNADVEKLTQSERLLLEADRGKYIRYYVTSIVINTHKILNRVSGRTKTFEDMVDRDIDMEMEREIVTKFSKKILSADFDIPESSIDAFLTFCRAQQDFSELKEAGNMMEVWNFLQVKSFEFKATNLPHDKDD
ncbi:hypothetical protein B0O79_3770 [Flavobacteriaceae bacterium MAR_2009_75]|nr:hypothetical protein B0O79_3770 [Flavobacteriaceae bacterium MAR_2009_75]